MARNPSLLVLVTALALATGCSGGRQAEPVRHRPPVSQAIRTCADRWNQDNMVGYGGGRAEVTIVRPARVLPDWGGLPGRPSCLIMYGSRSRPAYCVLFQPGAYQCPYSDMSGPEMTHINARIDNGGRLKLDVSLVGTHPVAPLPWMRYPHVDAYIHPWTKAGKLRRGLSLRAWKKGHGRCWRGAEEVLDRSALGCLVPTLSHVGPCYPRRRLWGAGDIAACATLGSTTFLRWRITARD